MPLGSPDDGSRPTSGPGEAVVGWVGVVGSLVASCAGCPRTGVSVFFGAADRPLPRVWVADWRCRVFGGLCGCSAFDQYAG